MTAKSPSIVRDDVLDALDRFRGPCGLCGHPDARHRVWDALMDSPDTDEETAHWYSVPVTLVQRVRELRPYRRRRRT